MKRKLSFISAALTAAVLFALCAPAQEEKETEETPSVVTETEAELTLNVCAGPEPVSLDPNMVSVADSSSYVLHLFEGLMKYVPDQTSAAEDGTMQVTGVSVVFGQAQSCDVSKDGLTFTFHLRDDITWSDGVPVTADDFVYSWRRLVDPETESPCGDLLNGIVENASAVHAGDAKPKKLGVSAPDPQTFVVHLACAYPLFQELCASAPLVPLRQDIIEEYEDKWTSPNNIVSNGMYLLYSWEHTVSLEMMRREDYYEPAAGPAELNWIMHYSAPSELSSFENGEYDFFTAVPVTSEKLYKTGIAHRVQTGGTQYIVFNAGKIYDWRVRAAIALAADQEYLLDQVIPDEGFPACDLVGTAMTDSKGKAWPEQEAVTMFAWLQEAYPEYDLTDYYARCDLANLLLDEARADGFDTSAPIRFLYNVNAINKAVVDSIATDIQAVLGLNIQAESHGRILHYAYLEEGDYDMALLMWRPLLYDPALSLVPMVTGAYYNFTGWSSDTYTQMFNNALTAPFDADRDLAVREAGAYLYTEDGFTIIPVYHDLQHFGMRQDLSGIAWAPFGGFIFSYASETD